MSKGSAQRRAESNMHGKQFKYYYSVELSPSTIPTSAINFRSAPTAIPKQIHLAMGLCYAKIF